MPSASYEDIGGSAGQAATPGPSSTKARPSLSNNTRRTYIDVDLEDEDEIDGSLKDEERADSVLSVSSRTGKKNKDKGKAVTLPKKFVEDDIKDQARKKAKKDKLKRTIKMNSQKYVYVGNLSQEVTDLMLEELFSSFGSIRSILIRSAGGYPSTSQPDSGGSGSGSRYTRYESRIYASVEFKNPVSVYRAMQLDGEELCGQRMVIVRDALDLPEFKNMIDSYMASSVPYEESSSPPPRGSRAKTEAAEIIPQPRQSTGAYRTSPSRLHFEHTTARIAYQFRPRVNEEQQQNTNTRSSAKSTRKR
ncbi:hypothetical protein BDY19DRAFT_990512 [Irpex rosettiformis]|uniref:Uncharacterized protein n=1 Tax=Irpex rosettiformis TaxID=378272 RepID=A0ACB8UER5_9APHY|nr:hypothetical protein BDY19DRAFT_990512 [Irpex rosettiformis]